MLRSLIGSTAEDVARRLGISAETVERIVEYQLAEERQIDPQRVITDIGLDELSLKKRHRLYVTLLTDLSDPTRPRILAVARGTTEDEVEKQFEGSGYGDFKGAVADAVVEFLSPVRERFQELRPDEAALEETLAAGAEKAQAIASATLAEVRSAIGIGPS